MSNRHTKKVVYVSQTRLVAILAAFFVLILTAGVLVLQGFQEQQNKVSEAQAKIKANSARIQESSYQACLNGVRILIKFNEQQKDLRNIAASRTDLPADVQRELVNVYERNIVEPIPSCESRRPPAKK